MYLITLIILVHTEIVNTKHNHLKDYNTLEQIIICTTYILKVHYVVLGEQV